MNARSLEELERRSWDALTGPDGASFYDELMAGDGLMVFPGLVLDKGASARSPGRHRGYRSSSRTSE